MFCRSVTGCGMEMDVAAQPPTTVEPDFTKNSSACPLSWIMFIYLLFPSTLCNQASRSDSQWHGLWSQSDVRMRQIEAMQARNYEGPCWTKLRRFCQLGAIFSEDMITEQPLMILILYITCARAACWNCCGLELWKNPFVFKFCIGFQTQIIMTTKTIPTVSKPNSHNIRPWY